VDNGESQVLARTHVPDSRFGRGGVSGLHPVFPNPYVRLHSRRWLLQAPVGIRMNPALTYRPDIDGLRALAIVPVVLGFAGGFLGIAFFSIVLLVVAGLGCKTAEGFGKDMENAGEGIQKGVK